MAEKTTDTTIDRTETEQMVEEGIQAALSGESSSMPTELVEEKKQKLATSARERGAGAAEAINRDALSRGLLRSGIATRNVREARLATEAEITRGEREIEIEKMIADHNDKMAALDRAENWLNNLRTYELGKERNQIAREQIAAQLSLGYASIQAQREAAAASRAMAGASLQLGRDELAFRERQWEESKIPIPPEMQDAFGADSVPASVFDTVAGTAMGGLE